MTLSLHPAAYLVRGLTGPTLAAGEIAQIDLLQSSLDPAEVAPALRAWYKEQARQLHVQEVPRIWCISTDGMLTVHVWPVEVGADWLTLAATYTDPFFHYRALGPDEVWN